MVSKSPKYFCHFLLVPVHLKFLFPHLIILFLFTEYSLSKIPLYYMYINISLLNRDFQ